MFKTYPYEPDKTLHAWRNVPLSIPGLSLFGSDKPKERFISMRAKVIRKTTRFLGWSSWRIAQFRNFGRKQRIIVMYHGVSVRQTYNCVMQQEFRRQLDWLSENYAIISLSRMVQELQDKIPSDKDQLAITFDDGYRNFVECAIPILVEQKIPVTLFMLAGKAGKTNDWDLGQTGYEKLELLDFTQLRSLPEDFVHIGSHGLYHSRLDQVPREEVIKELAHSRSILEQKLGRPITLFSFPYGIHYDRRRQRLGNELLREAGYQAACTTRWGRFNQSKDIYALCRIGIQPDDNSGDFIAKMTGYYDWLAAKEALGNWVRHRSYYFKKSGSVATRHSHKHC